MHFINYNFYTFQPSFYGVAALLPGKPTTLKLRGKFPFLLLSCLMPLVDFASDIGTAGTRSTFHYDKCLYKVLILYNFHFFHTEFLSIELNCISAWTLRTSTDSIRMTIAWAQLIHITLVTFFAGNSFIQTMYLYMIQHYFNNYPLIFVPRTSELILGN